MKIAFIGLRMTVGIRLITSTLSDALVRKGHQVVFCGDAAYEPPQGLNRLMISDGKSYLSVAGDMLRPSLYRRACEFLRNEKPDICYFISVHPAAVLLARKIRRTVRSPRGEPPIIAMHIHDPTPHPGLEMVPVLLTQHLQVRSADYVVVYGAQLKETICRRYGFPADRVVTIPHGASRPPRSEPPRGGFWRWFTCVGRIESYKGIEVFLAAARRLRTLKPEARFVLAGAGDLRPYRSALQALGDSVMIKNWQISNEETDQIMQESWAVVLPYTSATQSGVIPIAYWNGAPVIVSSIGALPETVLEGRTGFLVPPGDVAAVTDRMAAMYGNRPARERMGSEAFAFYDRHLRWDTIERDLIGAMSR